MSVPIEIDPDLDNYCVVGNPVTHSKSPQIHLAFATQTGQAIDYRAIEVAVDKFDDFLVSFMQAGGKGMNVTLPFKQQACTTVASLTRRAARCGSVNTIWFDHDGATNGDTTDGCGLVRDLSNNGIDMAGSRVFILGAGGAVRGVITDLFDAGASRITVSNRTESRARDLVQHFREYPELDYLPVAALATHPFDLLINGTSASLQGRLPAMPADLTLAGKIVYDMAYADQDTVFTEWARKQDAAVVLDGLGMLVEQAAESFYIWRGVRPETRPVIEMLRKG